ncbi:biotin--[acetyl-CoA-carboxylase] ligase [Flavobacterium sp. MAH-1]|uniref:Biotin--[acetyl-CoA-carboxylase] ligase n=1 Tax=Flavobacterium agri TaxID=2743471 RepID=A0A7Y8Y6L9_9FLAO|nr:biotin--[acetyl-CoA-carboxylase] ligase [Flavobacterium agri]NUY82131.1 biotin--[acetyl-CoA-carboxylase] ligase [Flavobacterium agri]NYA72155.1 biotin--[acetyl-CoA-carboxylase] ligase [Flavobacterium agri]
MHLIKLDAIGSTNDYLKDLSKTQNLSDFTVVTAEIQTSGRGQRGTVWNSEPGKNLTMSVFVRVSMNDASELFALNALVALSVLETLNASKIPGLSLKWPNDIMSGRKKIGGILIENNVKTATEFDSVIGIGLNVNQTAFDGLPNASSLFVVSGQTFDKETLCLQIVDRIRERLDLFKSTPDEIWETYNRSLFRKGIPTAFKDTSDKQFMGIITEAARDGQLKIMLEDDSVRSFGLKEVTMLF